MSVARIESLEARRLLADTLAATVDVAKPRQTIDAIGAALNSGWQLPEYRSAEFLNKAFGDLVNNPDPDTVRRFVKHQDAWLAEQGPADRQHLAFAA